MSQHSLTAIAVLALGVTAGAAQDRPAQAPRPSESAPAPQSERAPVGNPPKMAASPMAATEEAARINDSIEVLQDLTGTPDHAIPQSLLDRAEAIVVIPSLIKGGFIVGAKHGRGVMSVRSGSSRAWSSPAFVKMTGGSIGWQVGAESVDLVLLVMNQDGMRQLLEDRFTIGGSLAATAGPFGRSATAATNAQMNAGLLAYSRSQGLFAGATFEGAALHADDDANEAFYGTDCDLQEVASGAHAPVAAQRAAADRWQSALAAVAGTAAK